MADRPAVEAAPISAPRSATTVLAPGDESSDLTSGTGVAEASADSVAAGEGRPGRPAAGHGRPATPRCSCSAAAACRRRRGGGAPRRAEPRRRLVRLGAVHPGPVAGRGEGTGRRAWCPDRGRDPGDGPRHYPAAFPGRRRTARARRVPAAPGVVLG